MPFIGPAAASLIAASISALVAGFSRRQVRSTTETSAVGTRNAMPVSLPLSDGMTLPTALAAPVEDGMMLYAAPRPPRQSLADGPSTAPRCQRRRINKEEKNGPVFWVAVVAWTVVMRPSIMPNLSWMTFASGARQLVVHDAFEMTLSSLL